MGRHARRAPPLGTVLDSSQPEPLHRQIWQQLRRAILERRLAPGTRLPSSRLMAMEFACAHARRGAANRLPNRAAGPHGLPVPALCQAAGAGVAQAGLAGRRQSVSLFARVAREAGDDVWIEEPGYPGVAASLAAAQVRAVPVPTDGSGFFPEDQIDPAVMLLRDVLRGRFRAS